MSVIRRPFARTPKRVSAVSAASALFVVAFAAPGLAGQHRPDHHQPPPSPLPCAASAFQARATSDVTITSATTLTTAAPVVSYCRVDGYVTTVGPGPTPNHVNFMVALPQGFNNRYYYVGEGGSAGYVPPPPAALLQQGYTVAGSDAGSPTPGVDYRFGFDRTKGLDWGSRGVHVATLATQAITRQYFALRNQRKALYTYLDGCSGGGRMANVEASLFPDDYDGVIAGAPGIDPNNILFFGRVTKFLLDNPDAWVPPALMTQLSDAVLARFDASDGAVDGLIWDYTKVHVNPAALGIPFTPAQLQTVNLMLQGLNLYGQTYDGYTLANPIGWSSFITGLTPPTTWKANPANRPAGYLVFDSASQGLFGPDFDFTTDMDFGNPAQVNLWNQTWNQTFVGSGNADPKALDAFRRAGGKMLIWHGVADNAITVKGTVDYYNELVADEHGLARTQSFARLFLVPGLNHCGGGVGPTDTATQALGALTTWVEHGKAPRSLVTNRAATTTLPERTFLLCAYPQQASFKGGLQNRRGLDVNDAANWTCRRK